MSDSCRVESIGAADRDLVKIAKKDSKWFSLISDAIKAVEDNGWILSTRSELIKVLDQRRHIGEIRLPGKGGYRLIFFWEDERAGRVLYITAMPQKKDVVETKRLNAFVDAAAERRRQFLALKKKMKN
jgi:mRNA-degrading endonuclease RelE of RelBE toxin-antitoxin system